MTLRQIRLEDDLILRKKSGEVGKIDDRVKQIVEGILETTYGNRGIGLACIQVGMLKRVIVVDMQDEGGKMVLIDPKIIEKSEDKQINTEGCLSVPGKNGYVKRPKIVVMGYTDLDEDTQRVTGVGYKAHCFCYELDYLGGVLYTDKVLNLSEEEVERLNSEK